MFSDEGGFLLVAIVHEDLIIHRKNVHEGINARQGEIILWACLALINEIHAYCPLAIGFLHHHYVRETFLVLTSLM